MVEMVSLKNRSLAMLENGAENDKEGKLLDQAATGFRTLVKKYPNGRLGLQNLCVTLLAKFQNSAEQQGNMGKDILSELESSLKKLQKLIPEDPDGWELAARLSVLTGNMEQAIELFREAAKKKNANVATYFQLVKLIEIQAQDGSLVEIRRLLESASKLTPNNLAIAINLLSTLGKQKDTTGVGTQLGICRELFRPLMTRVGSSVPKLLDGVRAGLEKEDWKLAQTQISFLKNVLLAEVAFQNDLNLLDPHTLEYVQLSLEGPTSLTQRASGSNAIKFVETPALVLSENVSAIACEDINLDSHYDVVIVANGSIQAWSVRGKPVPIWNEPLGIACSGICLADFDRDFQRRVDALPPSALPTSNAPDAPESSKDRMVDTDVDLIVYGPEGLQLYENVLENNSGNRTLKMRPLSDEMKTLRGVTSVAVIDLDHDCDLDLAIASDTGVSLWSNRGDWSFADFTSFSSLPEPGRRITSILALDADRNVLNDFLLGSEAGSQPIVLANNLHGRYHVRDLPWPESKENICSSIEVVDVNSDGCWDLLTCGEAGLRLVTMKSMGRHSWKPDNVIRLSNRPSIGLMVDDWDNDSYSDCIAWGTQGIEIFRGGSDGKLEKSSNAFQGSEPVMQLISFDWDQDGDEDLVARNNDGSLLWYKNDGGNASQQLRVVLRADEDGSQRPRERCNMHGVGSLIELKSGGAYQCKIVRGTRTRFGIGKQTGADVMRVLWTNGTPNNVLDISNHSTIFDQQKLAGSCPYLYTWNGERFEFFTDCLWAAPIGLQFAPGVIAPSREWEYLKIDGTALKPKDGRYCLQVTEELWEAAYFDSIQLMAVDHPAKLDVYSNEKVGPADIAQFRIHTVEHPRQCRAVDKDGNELTGIVASRDRQYSKTWNQGLNQGLTETHWLEVDLNVAGDSSDEKMIYLTGWLFPTCTSLNLAMDENPSRPETRPLSIHVPDADGNWVEVLPYAGFPGGKTKTIAIDLSGKFLCSDHRVRLVSNMELCWDEVFFTVRETQPDPKQYKVTPLKLMSADLHYRGFSAQVLQPKNAPSFYDYHRVGKESIWPPMTGAFTRFGDVVELLSSADDLQVVMGAGDELTLSFASQEAELPTGWVRDFVIYNVGWDKDADLNTIYGQDVGPLPFRGMLSYPYGPEQQFPTTPQHKQYLNRYQTRNQEAGLFWNQIRDSQ